jgi:hypothetical protein
MLYAKPPQAPQLENRAPFCAPPLLVSATDAYRDGEYLYQDYLFDDRGADTVEGPGGQRDSAANFSPTSGNVFYPRRPLRAERADPRSPCATSGTRHAASSTPRA